MKIAQAVTAAAGVAGLLLGATSGPAQAKAPVAPVDHYSGTVSFDHEDCGLELHVDNAFSGVSATRPAPGSEGAFLLHDRYRFTETIRLTSAPAGPYVTTRGSGNFAETRATLIDPSAPTIYRFTTVDAGTFRLYSSDGELLVSTSGVYKATNVQDTLGDKLPGSQFIEEVSGQFHGRQSGEFCAAVRAALT